MICICTAYCSVPPRTTAERASWRGRLSRKPCTNCFGSMSSATPHVRVRDPQASPARTVEMPDPGLYARLAPRPCPRRNGCGRCGRSDVILLPVMFSVRQRATPSSGPYRADQLLLPMTLAGGGAFTMVKPTQHSLTAAGIIECPRRRAALMPCADPPVNAPKPPAPRLKLPCSSQEQESAEISI